MQDTMNILENENLAVDEVQAEAIEMDIQRLEELYGIPVLGVVPTGPGKRTWFRRRKGPGTEPVE